MLIYALREPSTATSHVSCPTVNTDSPDAPIPVPPPRAMEAIKTLNGAHDESCELFAKRSALLVSSLILFQYKLQGEGC